MSHHVEPCQVENVLPLGLDEAVWRKGNRGIASRHLRRSGGGRAERFERLPPFGERIGKRGKLLCEGFRIQRLLGKALQEHVAAGLWVAREGTGR